MKTITFILVVALLLISCSAPITKAEKDSTTPEKKPDDKMLTFLSVVAFMAVIIILVIPKK